MLGMKVKDIAAMEGITPSQAGKSIHAALRRLVHECCNYIDGNCIALDLSLIHI